MQPLFLRMRGDPIVEMKADSDRIACSVFVVSYLPDNEISGHLNQRCDPAIGAFLEWVFVLSPRQDGRNGIRVSSTWMLFR